MAASSQNKRNLDYDPDQNVEEKRDTRRKYRDINKALAENDRTITPDQISSILQDTNTLFDNVKTPDDAIIDSNILKAVSSIGAQRAKAMKGGAGSFDVEDFISKVLFYIGVKGTLEEEDDANAEADGSRLNWEKIGRKALGKSRRVPTTDFMLGPLSIEQKKRAVGKRAKLEKNKDDMRKPQEIREEDIAKSENETSKNVGILEECLAQCGEINLFKFIINPHDFAQSVENLFHLAFSIRDGKVTYETNESGEPIIWACEEPSDQDRASGQLQKRQMLMEFDMATWRRAIEVFNITEPMIPQRPAARTRIGNKWYG